MIDHFCRGVTNSRKWNQFRLEVWQCDHLTMEIGTLPFMEIQFNYWRPALERGGHEFGSQDRVMRH